MRSKKHGSSSDLGDEPPHERVAPEVRTMKMSEERRSLHELWQEWEDLNRLLVAAFWTWKTFLTPSHWRKELNEAEHIEKFCNTVRRQ